jgi:hypothetical protein
VLYGTERSDCVKRQEDHCYSYVYKYFSIHLSIYIIVFFLFTFCLSLSKKICYFPLGNFMQTEQKHTRKWLVIVGFHQNKCVVIYGEMSDSMKRQEDR